MAEQPPQREADGTWRIARDNRPALRAQAVADADGAVWVHLGEEVIVVPAEGSGVARSRAHAPGTLEAPMPAQVTAVAVSPGDQVDAGATLVLLEAMKMELPLRAPAAGRVTAVHCVVGQRVAPGKALVDLAPLDEDAR